MLRHYKAEPTEYVRLSVKGRAVKEGKGISGFFMPYKTSIEKIDTATIDQHFVFREINDENQEITFQGGFLYRVTEPEKTLSMFNFTVDKKMDNYISDDSHKLPEYISHMIRSNARKIVQGSALEELLVIHEDLSEDITKKVAESGEVADMGVEIQMIYFSEITPSREIRSALGAKYREELMQQEDKATYERRAMAVEQERAIKENKLKNDIELEQQRATLVELQGKNVLEEAQYNAEASTFQMDVYKDMDAETIRAHALQELAKNAHRIETLTITPEILAGLKD